MKRKAASKKPVSSIEGQVTMDFDGTQDQPKPKAKRGRKKGEISKEDVDELMNLFGHFMVLLMLCER